MMSCIAEGQTDSPASTEEEAATTPQVIVSTEPEENKVKDAPGSKCFEGW